MIYKQILLIASLNEPEFLFFSYSEMVSSIAIWQ